VTLRIPRKARKYLIVPVLVATALAIQPTLPASAAADTMTVNFSLFGGAPTYRATGFIYGVSQNASSPSTSMTDQIKVKQMRGGGSQIGCPNGGWVNGVAGYTARWNFLRAYYNRALRTGAHVEIIIAALWGSDGRCNVPRWPGDNGNWTEFTNMLNRIIADARAAGMTGSNVRWDIWNEPNIFFWGRSQAQYFEMYRRATLALRSALPNSPIVGPSCACGPNATWFGQVLKYVRANNVVPNILSWHALPGDPAVDAGNANSALSSRGLSVQGFSVNEYGAFGAEQQPGPSAWYIARLERCNCDGSRANWGNVGQTPSLYDTLGWLTTSNAGQPMGQWWVYKRYADQTGQRTNITPGGSHDGIVFQDSGARRSLAVYGARAGAATGAIDVRYTNIPSWLPTNGSVNVRVERMPSTNAFVSAPTVVSNARMTVSGNAITVTINWTNANDAYAITLSA
jgi:hypothetical protein